MNLKFYRTWMLSSAVLMSLVVLQFNLPNLGNNLIPRNFFAWASLVLSAMGLLIYASRQSVFYWSSWCLFWLVPLFAILVHGLIIPSVLPHYGVLAAGALFAFALWLVALVQARLNNADWHHISLVVLGGVALLVLLAMPSGNYLNQPQWLESVPLPMKLPEGGFQQRNVFASFVASTMMWAWAMRLRACSGRPAFDLMFALVLFFCSWCVYLSGSRTGSVALSAAVLGLAFIALSRGWRHTGLWLPLGAVFVAFLLSLYLPIGDLNERMADLADGGSTRTRLSMWEVSYLLGFDSPWFGHGLGSFTEVFHPKFVELVLAGSELDYVNFLNHPHNETLLWWVETGLFGIALIIVPWVVSLFFMVIWKNPSAGLFAVALGPMLLHTQTEFPLHTSGVHWWLAGLIIVSVVRPDLLPGHQVSPRKFWPALIGSLGALAIAGLVHSGWLSHQNWKSTNAKYDTTREFLVARSSHPALQHFLLGAEARDFWTLSLIRIAIQTNNKAEVSNMLPKLEDMQQRWQGPQVWRTLAAAYQLLGQQDRLERHLKWVIALQPGFGAQLQALVNQARAKPN